MWTHRYKSASGDGSDLYLINEHSHSISQDPFLGELMNADPLSQLSIDIHVHGDVELFFAHSTRTYVQIAVRCTLIFFWNARRRSDPA